MRIGARRSRRFNVHTESYVLSNWIAVVNRPVKQHERRAPMLLKCTVPAMS